MTLWNKEEEKASLWALKFKWDLLIKDMHMKTLPWEKVEERDLGLSEREFREFTFDGGLFYLGVFGSKSLHKYTEIKNL